MWGTETWPILWKLGFYLTSIGAHAKSRQQWELLYCITFLFLNIFFSPFSNCSLSDYCTCCLWTFSNAYILQYNEKEMFRVLLEATKDVSASWMYSFFAALQLNVYLRRRQRWAQDFQQPDNRRGAVRGQVIYVDWTDWYKPCHISVHLYAVWCHWQWLHHHVFWFV